MDLVGRFIGVFCDAAIQKGDGTDTQDKVYLGKMQEAYFQLTKHPRGLSNFESLLNHENNWVKCWVAAQLLSEFGNQEALTLLTKLSNSGGVVGFTAETTISEYNAGNLMGPLTK